MYTIKLIYLLICKAIINNWSTKRNIENSTNFKVSLDYYNAAMGCLVMQFSLYLNLLDLVE